MLSIAMPCLSRQCERVAIQLGQAILRYFYLSCAEGFDELFGSSYLRLPKLVNGRLADRSQLPGQPLGVIFPRFQRVNTPLYPRPNRDGNRVQRRTSFFAKDSNQAG